MMARVLRLQSKLTKKFKVTTDSNHKLNIAPNLVSRNFSPNSSQGFIYLTTVEREIEVPVLRKSSVILTEP